MVDYHNDTLWFMLFYMPASTSEFELGLLGCIVRSLTIQSTLTHCSPCKLSSPRFQAAPVKRIIGGMLGITSSLLVNRHQVQACLAPGGSIRNLSYLQSLVDGSNRLCRSCPNKESQNYGCIIDAARYVTLEFDTIYASLGPSDNFVLYLSCQHLRSVHSI